jgi:hypothetical protein
MASDLTETIISYIENNPKDFVNICFLFFTGTLALLTYRNAKKTLFNPIRSEMVKYQMKAITEFVDNHTSKGFTFDNSIDYSNLLKLNYETDYLFDILTNESKFQTHAFDEIDNDRSEYCRRNLGGLFELSVKQNKLYFEMVYGDFDTAKQYIQTKFIKEKEQNNKSLILQRFYITKNFYSFFTDLINLKTNPFIPDIIKRKSEIIISNIYKNIQILYEILSVHISEQANTTYQEVYSKFNAQRIDHEKDLNELRNIISAYFKVNKV